MRSRLILLAVMAVFLLPLVLAWWFNFGPWPWRPPAERNRGELIQPPLQIVTDPDAGSEFLGHWSLIFLTDAACEAFCQARLNDMRQSWLALGKDARRVRRWLLLAGGGALPPQVAGAHPGLTVLMPGAPAVDAVVRSLRAAGPAGAIYLADPRGFVILRYGAANQASDLVQDLERLLRYSAVDR